MSIRKAAMAALVAGSMVVVPTVAQAQQANQTAGSIRSAQVRQGANVQDESDIRGGSAIVAIIALVAIITAVIVASKGKGRPMSP